MTVKSERGNSRILLETKVGGNSGKPIKQGDFRTSFQMPEPPEKMHYRRLAQRRNSGQYRLRSRAGLKLRQNPPETLGGTDLYAG